MKVRTISLGLILEHQDFIQILGNKTSEISVNTILMEKFQYAKVILDKTREELERLDYIIQTQRIYLNSFEDWLLPLLQKPYELTLESIVLQLVHCLEAISIQFCTIGSCSKVEAIQLIPQILALSDRLSSSILFRKTTSTTIAPDRELCVLAAKTCLDIAENLGDLGNFRFCTSFNCPPGIPFFPAAYHQKGIQSSNTTRHCSTKDTVEDCYKDNISMSIGFESGDLLFLAFHGADTHSEGRDNLADIMKQAFLPIQRCAMSICNEFNIEYIGIDASINPGLSIPDSIGVGIESLLSNNNKTEDYAFFGCMGTLAAVSTITSAIKSLAIQQQHSATVSDDIIKLAGYSGLMLPVMEDLILAQRAIEGKYTLRDLLTFSSVCGVGLDTVPIPGNIDINILAGIYMEVAAMAFRLEKPLSCRLLPIKDKVAGDITEINSPYLCNTVVFNV